MHIKATMSSQLTFSDQLVILTYREEGRILCKNPNIGDFVKKMVAEQNDIEVGQVNNDTIVRDPAAIQVAVENMEGTIKFGNKSFLDNITWGEVLAANATGTNPTVNTSP